MKHATITLRRDILRILYETTPSSDVAIDIYEKIKPIIEREYEVILIQLEGTVERDKIIGYIKEYLIEK